MADDRWFNWLVWHFVANQLSGKWDDGRWSCQQIEKSVMHIQRKVSIDDAR
jgi:hypothetical protein